MRIKAATVLAALTLTACGGDTLTPASPTTTLPPSTAAPTTTLAPTTTTTLPPTTTTTQSPTTTTTQSPTTTTTLPPTTTTGPWVHVITIRWDGGADRPPHYLGPNNPDGSGCSPPGDTLPDGVWFGFAEAVSGGVITFDLACYFSGDAVAAAAAADGEQDEGQGYYIRNQNPKVFSVPIAPDAQVFWIEGGPPPWFNEPLPLASWPSPNSWLPCPGESCAVWLYVNGGAATGIVEEFLE